MVFLRCRGCARRGRQILKEEKHKLLEVFLKRHVTKLIQTVITYKLEDLNIVFWVNLTEMRNFPYFLASAETEYHTER